VVCSEPNKVWDVHYDDGGTLRLDFRYTALMDPFDIHDPDQDPMVAAKAAGSDFSWGHAYSGHFDQTGHYEGELSLRLNALVNAEALSEISEQIGLPELVRAGSDVRNLEGRKRTNLRADALESLIAVLYLDGGLDAARAFIHRYWQPRSQAIGAARRDAKTELQEWAHQAAAGAVPAYRVDGREGPDHDPLFTVSVKVGSFAPAIGSGRSKREAEQAAASALLLREGVWSAA